MVHSHEPLQAKVPAGERVEVYPNAAQEVYKQDGLVLPFDGLGSELAHEPVSVDMGVIYVQTIDGQGNRKRYYFDQDYAADGQTHQLAMLKNVPKDGRYDITIGQPWDSPFGKTDKVEAVARPWPHATPFGATEKPQSKAAVAMGRDLMDKLVSDAKLPSRLSI